MIQTSLSHFSIVFFPETKNAKKKQKKQKKQKKIEINLNNGINTFIQGPYQDNCFYFGRVMLGRSICNIKKKMQH